MNSAEWIASQIIDHDKVLSAKAMTPDYVIAERKSGDKVRIGVTSEKRLELEHLQKLQAHDRPDVIVNIPKEAVFSGRAIAFAGEHGIALGGYGDLLRALDMDIPREHVNPEIAFVSRSLGQHSRVTDIDRLDNRRYLVHRKQLPPVTVLVINEYEITADVVREAIAKFQTFDAIVCSNPNGRTTAAGEQAASSASLPIWTWREFFGQLNRAWTSKTL